MDTKKSLTNLVLFALEKSIDGFLRVQDLRLHPGKYMYYGGWEDPITKSRLTQVLKRLRERGLIEIVGEEELIYRLTDTGKDQALWAIMKMEDDKWDGKWRLVFWDIPEKRRAARDLLRMKLKQMGFVRWQKSVWASKKNCTQVLRTFIKQVGIQDWVMVIESDNIK